MARYRRKEREIEAMLYPANLDIEGMIALEDWLIPRLEQRGLALTYDGLALMLPRTLGGEIAVLPGEWLIEGAYQVFGELYEPVKDG